MGYVETMKIDTGKSIPTASVSEKRFDDRTLIAASTLLHLLDGVAIATNAPDQLVKPLSLSLQQADIRKSNKPWTGFHPAESKSTHEAALPVSTWRAIIASNSSDHKEGITQLADITLAVALLREQSRRGITLSPSTLDSIWHLVHTTITASSSSSSSSSSSPPLLKFTVSRSAQGFLSIPLCSLIRNNRISELIRVHVWLPDHERGVPDVSIHSHQPFAQSWILAGKGTDRRFEVSRVAVDKSPSPFSSSSDVEDVDDEAIAATHAEYALCWTDTSNTDKTYKTHQLSSTVENTGRLLRVRPLGEATTHVRNESYSVPGGEFHQSVIPGGEFHATLFFFDAERGFVEDAGVAGPKDGGRFTQIRDPRGITAGELVRLTEGWRRREEEE